MIVSVKLRNLLDAYQVDFQVLHHPPTQELLQAAITLKLPLSQVLNAQVMVHAQGHTLVVWPLDRELIASKVKDFVSPPFEFLDPQSSDLVFPDCEPGAIPALGEPYGLSLLVDRSVFNLAEVYFASGSLSSFIRLSGEDYQFLLVHAFYGNFTVEKQLEQVPVAFSSQTPPAYSLVLPELPPQAIRLLGATPTLKENILQELRTQEPFLETILGGLGSLLDYSSFPDQKLLLGDFGHALSVTLLQAKQYRLQVHGPLGARALWRHSSFAAILAREIVLMLRLPLDSNLALALGFFHNIGYLLFGHLFSPEFQLLNRMFLTSPLLPIEQHEKRLLGMGDAQSLLQQGHTALGAWLAKQWQLPQLVSLVAQYHHQEHYKGEHQEAVALIFIVDQLLRQADLGDGQLGSLSPYYLQILGTNAQQMEALAEQFLKVELVLAVS